MIEGHVDDSVTTRDYHSNSDARDVEPISEPVANVTEDSIKRKCESPDRSSNGTRKDKTNRKLHVPDAYSAKLEDLKQLVDPIENRYKDEEARAQTTRDLLGCIVEHRMSAGSLPPQNKELIINECNKAEQWLREKMQQQDALPKSCDPVFWSSDIKTRTEELNLVCQQILRSKGPPIPENKGKDKQNTSSYHH